MFTKLWFLYDKAKAIEYYNKSLNLWKDADPDIADLEDARKRLAKLKVSNSLSF